MFYTPLSRDKNMKSLFRIFIAIISGVSTYFAFPLILISLTTGVLSRSISGFEFFIVPFACVAVLFLVYYALKYRDVEKVQTPKKVQAFVAFSAGFLTFITFVTFGGISSTGGISSQLWGIVLYLNVFFFSTIVLLSLYYFQRLLKRKLLMF